MRYHQNSTGEAVSRKMSSFENELRSELPQITHLSTSIATAQLLLDMQRARFRYLKLLDDSKLGRASARKSPLSMPLPLALTALPNPSLGSQRDERGGSP